MIMEADPGAMKTFVCDPARNTACGKDLCFEHGGPCGVTDDVRCALRDLIGRPVEILEEPKEERHDEP